MRTHRKIGASAGRIVPSGPYFVDPSGALVIRRSLTAFVAPKRFMEGRDSDARAYFDWAASKGANEVRAFSRTNWTGPPGIGVEPGWFYSEGDCEACIVEAGARGLRLELTAHTYDSGNLDEMVEHTRRVDELCLRHDNAQFELYNEPQQNGGHDLVRAILARYTPKTPGWSSGCYEPVPDPSGPSVSYHSPRKDQWSRCFKDAYEFHDGSGPTQPFQPPFTGPVMLDEPPQVEQTVRDQEAAGWAAEDDWRAYGAGAAFFAAGATMHSNPQFQKCEIPTDSAVLACVEAFYDGFTKVPIQRYSGYNRLDPPSSNPGSRRYQRSGADGKRYEITVRPFGFKVL